MKKQHIASLALAGTMALSLAAPALAANNTSTVITSTYKDVEIAVVVPTTGTAVINPYGLPVKYELKGDSEEVLATATISGQKITTAPLSIRNQGEVDLEVNAVVTAAQPKGSTVELAAKASISKATTKVAFVQLDVVGNDSLVGDDSAVDTLLYGAVGTESNWTSAVSIPVTAFDTGATSKNALATLKAATMDEGAFSAYAAGSVAMFRLSGDCVEGIEDDPWTTKDAISVTVAFTFKPAASSD